MTHSTFPGLTSGAIFSRPCGTRRKVETKKVTASGDDKGWGPIAKKAEGRNLAFETTTFRRSPRSNT
jgi:hypothetical protein